MGALSLIALRELKNGIKGVAQRKRVTLTSAQILALNATPVELLPAPGAGYANVVQEVVASLDAGATQYTGANALEIRYTNGSGSKVTGDIAAALIDSATDRMDRAIAAAVTSIPANAAVVAVVPTADPAAGDGTITLEVLYRVVKL